MRGFKEHGAADRFCREHNELRNFLRSHPVTTSMSQCPSGEFLSRLGLVG
jgi:hypothetical protein